MIIDALVCLSQLLKVELHIFPAFYKANSDSIGPTLKN